MFLQISDTECHNTSRVDKKKKKKMPTTHESLNLCSCAGKWLKIRLTPLAANSMLTPMMTDLRPNIF